MNLAFNDSVLNQVIGSVGMKDINAYIKNIVDGLGKTDR
jgi:hypothetical protein